MFFTLAPELRAGPPAAGLSPRGSLQRNPAGGGGGLLGSRGCSLGPLLARDADPPLPPWLSLIPRVGKPPAGLGPWGQRGRTPCSREGGGMCLEGLLLSLPLPQPGQGGGSRWLRGLERGFCG